MTHHDTDQIRRGREVRRLEGGDPTSMQGALTITGIAAFFLYVLFTPGSDLLRAVAIAAIPTAGLLWWAQMAWITLQDDRLVKKAGAKRRPAIEELPAVQRIRALARAYHAIEPSAFSREERDEVNRLLDKELPKLKSLYRAAVATAGEDEAPRSRALFELGLGKIESAVRSRLEWQAPLVLERLETHARSLAGRSAAASGEAHRGG